MKWIAENWMFVVLILAMLIVPMYYLKKFTTLPSSEQQEKVKEWLLAVVIEAERIFKNDSGKVKLSWVYNRFVEAFPELAKILPFELFSSLVDEVLVQMRKLLESNQSIRNYVGGL